LIFLRFFQAPNAERYKRGYKGLGLGLFLARQIAEQHMGQLNFVRTNNNSGVFRFIWPLSDEALEAEPITLQARRIS